MMTESQKDVDPSSHTQPVSPMMHRGDTEGAEAVVIPDIFTQRDEAGQPQSIAARHWIEQSLYFAELSRFAYLCDKESKAIFSAIGMEEIDFLDRDGAQAYLLGTKKDLIVVCRGTEPHEWNDLKADANAWTVLAEVGRLHRGFKQEVDDLWPMIERAIRENQRPVWFAGHSLGGAMATVCAGRCKLSSIPSNPKALFTFGSPRVGNRAYIHAVKLPHYRWVHNNDIVARVPPRWLGYKHSGFELYLDSKSQLRNIVSWNRVRDRFRGFWTGLLMGRIDYLSDHPIRTYIQAIRGCWVDHKNGKPIPNPKVFVE
jgi:triacylglycerol lipase